MEKKEFSSPARRYGKFFIAFIFITAGVLLLARNLGWISYTLFGILVSWQMLLILLGIYLMLRRQILLGGILLANRCLSDQSVFGMDACRNSCHSFPDCPDCYRTCFSVQAETSPARAFAPRELCQ